MSLLDMAAADLQCLGALLDRAFRESCTGGVRLRKSVCVERTEYWRSRLWVFLTREELSRIMHYRNRLGNDYLFCAKHSAMNGR